MDVEVVKLSSRGQLVIPEDMREDLDLKKGEKLLLVERGGVILMKSVRTVGEELATDLIALARAEEAWVDIEEGRAKKMSKKEFLKELAEW